MSNFVWKKPDGLGRAFLQVFEKIKLKKRKEQMISHWSSPLTFWHLVRPIG
jgi:hypothetical protein